MSAKKKMSWIVRGAAAVAAAMVLMPAAAQAQQQREIWFENDCQHPIRFFISHADGWRNWHTHGWWNFRAFQQPTRLIVDSATIYQRDDHDFFFWAETTDGPNHTWQGDESNPYRVTYNGIQYKMRKATIAIDMNKMNIRITCDGR